MKTFFKDNLRYILGGFLVLVLFSLRFYHLTLLPVFADEAIYVRWAQIMKAEETLRFLPLSDGKQPLYMWIVIPFLKIFRDPLIAGRVVSVLSGFGTLVGVTVLSWLLFKSKKVTFVSAFIYALMPYTFFFDRMALVDSMLSMFGIWTFIFAYLAVTTSKLDYAMLAGFSLGGAWLTKSPALFFALLLPTILFFAKWQNNYKQNLSTFLKGFYLLTVTFVLGYGLNNILRLGPNFSLVATRNLDYVYPLSHFLLTPLDPLKPFLFESGRWLIILGTAGVVLLAIGSYVFNFKKYTLIYLVLAIWLFGPIFIEAEFAKVLTARYIYFTIPYLIIIAGACFIYFSKKWYLLFLTLLTLFLIQSVIFDFYLLKNPLKANLPRSERSGYLEEWTAGQGIAQAASYLENYKLQNPNDKIVVGTEGYFGTLPDGLQIYLNKYPEITVIGVGLNFTNVPKPLKESRDAGNKTYLLINNERFKGDPEKEGLKLIAEYPKAMRPDGTHQSLLFFELK